VIGTQIARPDRKRPQSNIHLHDAKDSGSIENSGSLMLGLYRPDCSTLAVKILKNTKGNVGRTIMCNFDGATMQLTERVAEESAPPYADE